MVIVRNNSTLAAGATTALRRNSAKINNFLSSL